MVLEGLSREEYCIECVYNQLKVGYLMQMSHFRGQGQPAYLKQVPQHVDKSQPNNQDQNQLIPSVFSGISHFLIKKTIA
jgi:hypothetical protein